MLRPPPSFQEFAEEALPTPRWIVDGLLPGDGWTLLVARAKTGKSLLAMQLAAALSNGEEFLGRASTRRRVLYIQLDAPPGDWQEQVRRIAESRREAPATYTRAHLPLYALDDPVRTELAQMIQAGGFGLVVWDALEKLTRLDLNTKEGCQSFLDRFRAAWSGPSLVVHHPRKPQGEGGGSMLDAAAGNHYLVGDASAIWGLSKEPGGKGRLTVVTRATEDLTVQLERDGQGLWRLASGERGAELEAKIRAAW